MEEVEDLGGNGAEPCRPEFVSRINRLLAEGAVSDGEKLNIQAFKTAVMSGKLDGHEGRFVRFNHGVAFENTFSDPVVFSKVASYPENDPEALVFEVPGTTQNTTFFSSRLSAVMNREANNGVKVAYVDTNIKVGEREVSLKMMVDSGSTFTSCPARWVMFDKVVSKPDEAGMVEVTSRWMYEPFYGPNNLHREKVVIDQTTANGTRQDFLLVYDEGAAAVTLSPSGGDVGPLKLRTLILSGDLFLKKEQKTEAQARNNPLPPADDTEYLIGRDILFRLVDTSSKKEARGPTHMSFEPRESTPPPSPTSDAKKIASAIISAGLDAAQGAGAAVVDSMRTAGAVGRNAIASASVRMKSVFPVFSGRK